MAFKTVRVGIDGRIATVTLDRAACGNRVTGRMASELRDACERLDRDDEIRVVVLTGEGDAFCRGTDFSALRYPGNPADVLRSLRAAWRIAAVEKPVIAAVNGDAVGQGLELALACDIRIASGNAGLGLTQVGDGLIPWDGGTQRLPRLVGRGRAMEMILTSRIVNADEALKMGLVNVVVGPGEALRRAGEMADAISRDGPIAARYLKEAVMKGQDMTLEQGLRLEADLSFMLQSTTDRAEGIRSFLERRAPEYRGE